jgi:hypothetical protein
MRQQGEPSVEDILDSIKKVIARDSKVASIAPAPRVAEEPAEDVLDLAGSPMVEAEEESALCWANTPAPRCANRWPRWR